MKADASKPPIAKSILESGKGLLSWKPKEGLVEIPAEREKLFRSLSEISGNTPLTQLDLLPNGNGLFVKMECENKPTGSHYDRIYPHLLHAIERIGVNPKDFVLIENSSGNATPAFGWFSRKLGYETIAFLPAELTDARKKLTIEQCDKVVVANPQKHGWEVFGAAGAIREALQKNREERQRNPSARRMYCVNHSQVVESLEAMESLANEIAGQLDGKKIDYFLGIAGNGTILYGLGRALKKLFGKMKVVGVETLERPVLFPLKYPGRYEKEYGKKPAQVGEMGGQEFFAPGTGALGVEFPHIYSAVGLVDDVMLVSREETEKTLAELGRKGFRVGHTSAMSFVAAQKISMRAKGKSILIIFYDNIGRY